MSVVEPRAFSSKGGGTVTIRSAVEADAEQILRNLEDLLPEPYNVTAPGEIAPSLEEEHAWIAAHREEPGRLAIVAEVDGRVVGLLDFQRGPRRRLHHRGAFGMSVTSPFRRRGIGDALVTTLLDWARAEPGIVKVCLAVYADNEAARRLYEKHGFVVEGRRLREIRLDDGTYADDVLMCRFVDP